MPFAATHQLRTSEVKRMKGSSLPFTCFVNLPDGTLKGMPSLQPCTHAVIYRDKASPRNWFIWSVESSKDQAESTVSLVCENDPELVTDIVPCECKELRWDMN